MLQHTLDDLAGNFALFDDWEERYRYLIDLGRNLPDMPAELKTEETKVRGCTSQVWMVAEKSGDAYQFTADSDAHIVRGLIALLLAAYQNKTAEEISAVDIEGVFADIGLDSHLSPNRRNGFFAMVERIQTLASLPDPRAASNGQSVTHH